MSADHTGFIVAAYAISAIVTLGMILALVLDHRSLRKALSQIPGAGRETDE